MAVGEGAGVAGRGRSFGSFKRTFFDAEAVLKAMDRTERKALSKAGAFVRQRARTSIKKAPKIDPKTGVRLKGRRKAGAATVDATARPGDPPFGHGPQRIRLIFFAYEPEQHTVVVGPAKFDNPRGGGPEFLEYGGTTTVRDRRGKKRREQFRGNPFMNPALDAERANILKFFEEAGF